MANYIDLSGVFNVQKNYLDLQANIGQSISADARVVSGKINTLQQSLDSIYNDYAASNANSSSVLTEQQRMIDIVSKENDRLQLKKSNVDDALTGKKRMVDLNESYRLRNASYNNILITVIITLVLVLVLRFISKMLPFLPSWLFDILIAVVICGGLYISYIIYLDILSRSKMNFNELALNGPPIIGNAELKKSMEDAAKAGNLLGSINISGCIGSDCCGPNTYWDSGNSICGNAMPRQTGFATIDVSLKDRELKAIQPNTPNEFADYIPYK